MPAFGASVLPQADLLFGQAGLSGLNGWVEERLAGDAGPLASFGLLFLGGLIASLLPCVYPLYPITAGIVRNRGAGSHPWTHPIAYYIGLCLAYAMFGVVAAGTGGAFNTVLRYGATNLALAVLFLVLGLSTIGLLHLSIFRPRGLEAGSGLVGTATMGAAAGLLSSACVGPVVVSVLINLAAAQAGGFSAWALVAAVAKMLAFGAGVGLPFLAVGLFGVKLPKSGSWMIYVQYLLGGLIFYFAYLYLEKGLTIYGLSADAIHTIAATSVGLVAFAYLWQTNEPSPHERTVRSLYCLGLVVCGTLFFHSVPHLDGATGQIVPTTVAAEEERAVEADAGLRWHLKEDRAYQKAKEQGKHVFIDFYGNWCTNCKAFAELTRTNAELRKALQQAVLLKVYDRTDTFRKYASDKRFPELKVGLPFFVITDQDGNLLYKTSDYLQTDEMALFVSDGN